MSDPPLRARRTGVWIVGVQGGVAGTVIAGARALARGLITPTGLVTETPLFAQLPLVDISEFVFGGHDIRSGRVTDSVAQIDDQTGTIPGPIRAAIADDLGRIDAECRPGVLLHSGGAIESIADGVVSGGEPAELLRRVEQDLSSFRSRHALERIVVVNLASTEPLIATRAEHFTQEGIGELFTGDGDGLIASTVYAVAAARQGCAYLNFTPSSGALLPGVVELFEGRGVPFMGSDGKTGETLLKSVLAPLFRRRNLRVHSWMGYNLLGDRDGLILSDDRNRAAKVASKDHLLREILGYPLHSQVAIDYVPSLADWKTAWDFIHFEGFLGAKMALQFTWQGCDAVLAAPLVLDMVRLLALALDRKEGGAQTGLACFFKSPHGVDTHDFDAQYRLLEALVARHSA